MFIASFPFILCLLFWATTHAYNYMYLLKMETSRIFIEMVVLKINHYLYNFGHIIHQKRRREVASVSTIWTQTGIVPHRQFSLQHREIIAQFVYRKQSVVQVSL